MPEGPQPVGSEPQFVSLTGTVYPLAAHAKPVHLRMSGSELLYLPCFSSVKLLQEARAIGPFKWRAIKSVEDEPSFLAQAYKDPSVRIIVDLHRSTDGRILFTEIQRFSD